ncbi:hypothetical protein Tco_1446282, partial [Tanacetum coccineum]
MPPKRMSTSEAPAMTQAAIKKLVVDSVFAALEAQATNMANTDNTTRPREAPVARQLIRCSKSDPGRSSVRGMQWRVESRFDI